MFKLILFINVLIFTNNAYAYLGPGIGGGVIAATIGIIVAIFAAVFGLIWFPIKRMLQRRKEKKNKKIILINHILLICSSVVIYEFIKIIKLTNILKFNLKIYKKIIKLFVKKNVSDLRKEKLILNYSITLLLTSIKIIITLISILSFMIILNLLSHSYLNFIMSIFGIIELSTVFLIYHLVRKKLYAKL